MAVRRNYIVGLLGIGLTCFVVGYLVGDDSYDGRQAAIVERVKKATLSKPYVQDAMRRWAAKNNATIERVMEGRSVEAMYFPDRTCVQLKIDAGGVGGVPIYCYALDTSDMVPHTTTRLVFEESNVE